MSSPQPFPPIPLPLPIAPPLDPWLAHGVDRRLRTCWQLCSPALDPR